jgi:hypothetical protein
MMNERIRLLAEQAGINIDSFQFSGTPIKHIVDEPSLEKFALLIIKDCLDQCYYRGMNDERYAGQLKAAAYIEEHFGVE